MKKLFSQGFTALIVLALVTSCKPSDEKISAAVKTALTANASLASVASDVKEGVVTLSGEVESEEVKAFAESALKEIKGLKSVVNNITVKPKGPTPEELAQQANDALLAKVNEAFSTYKVSGITATAKDGVVTLTGEVKRSELQNVMKAAMESGAIKVENQMTIIK